MNFENVYNSATRAESYAKLDFPNTYYLAYRDLPEIIARHSNGKKAIDFGCGAGRSTRFLKNLGYDATGIDISPSMVAKAREYDPSGKYVVVRDGQYGHLGWEQSDLVLSVFTFDNIPGVEKRIMILKGLTDLLKPDGKIILLDSTPELYMHEWASFSTENFPENKVAKAGDIVRVIMNDVVDKRPVEDVFWRDEDYQHAFKRAGLTLEQCYKPLGKEQEPFDWKMETQLAPWIIYVLKKTNKKQR
jgi:SAM-dependent methyltransferase